MWSVSQHGETGARVPLTRERQLGATLRPHRCETRKIQSDGPYPTHGPVLDTIHRHKPQQMRRDKNNDTRGNRPVNEGRPPSETAKTMTDLASVSSLKSFSFAPDPMVDWALFLDLDGTLLDIAPTPDSVVVPQDLIADLTRASRALNGALAIVSGRALETIDRLMSPLQLPVGSEHGAIIRLPNGFYDEVELSVPADWIAAIQDFAARTPGVLIEAKHHNIVAHYRNAPAQEARLHALIQSLVARDADTFEMLEAKMAFEIRARNVSKARPVHALMNVAPFAGRTPVFVGDDKTDEDGFRAAIEFGGIALDVAAAFAGQPAHVRDWLKRFADL
jgi:trehalose 6-phosphate phosphatase